MNENTNNVSLFTKISVISVGTLGTAMFLFALFAPAFLPSIECELNKQYAKFSHREDIVKAEMEKYRRKSWTIAIIAWVLFFILLTFSGYPV